MSTNHIATVCDQALCEPTLSNFQILTHPGTLLNMWDTCV